MNKKIKILISIILILLLISITLFITVVSNTEIRSIRSERQLRNIYTSEDNPALEVISNVFCMPFSFMQNGLKLPSRRVYERRKNIYYKFTEFRYFII